MDAATLSKADYLDILFDNRNKQYGGYELRRHYDKRIKAALFTVLALCAALSAYAFISSGKPQQQIAMLKTTPNKITDIIYEHKKVEIEKPKLPAAPPAVKRTVANAIPKVVKDDKVITPPATKEDLTKAESGIITTTSTPGGETVVRKPAEGSSHIVTPAQPPSPIVYAEEMPQFMGDIIAYLSSHLHYPDAARSQNIEGKVIIKFVVNEDGSVSDAKVSRGIGGGCDEEAVRVVSGMPKWKPGKHMGKAVKVYYTLPIRFTLE